MKIEKFKTYTTKVTESLSDNLEDSLSDDFKELKMELLDMVETSLNSTDSKVVNTFIKSYSEEDSESVIEGLVNDSDIYEFYLKYTESIDEVLNSEDFFKKSPNEQGVIGLYDYLVFGTQLATFDVIGMIKEDLGL